MFSTIFAKGNNVFWFLLASLKAEALPIGVLEEQCHSFKHQIRGGIEDNSMIFFLIFQRKHML